MGQGITRTTEQLQPSIRYSNSSLTNIAYQNT